MKIKKVLKWITGGILLSLSHHLMAEFHFNIFQMQENGSPIAPVEGDTLSISQHQQICWAVSQLNEKSVLLVETLTSPQPLKISSVLSPMKVQQSPDKKTSMFITPNKAVINHVISGCSGFEDSDPKGVYKFKLTVNDVEMPVKTFTVTK